MLGRLALGKRVTVINGKGGNWAEYAVIPSRQARPVAKDIPDEQVASFFVNPATVLAMVRAVLKVPKGAWLLQTAAGSELGKMIIRLGRHDGFKTLNVVRRSEAKAELQEMGADAVISSSEGKIDDQVRSLVGPEGVRYAIDPVSGETGTQVFRSLAPNGRMLLYGSLSEDPIQIESRLMIAGDRTLSGFWLGHWMRQQNVLGSLAHFRQITQLMREGVLTSEIGKKFGLDQVREAVVQAEAVGRKGKVLLEMGSAGGNST